uniref:Uncharacterized protein n=1 Tax=Magallana gigas TaxID=29159 RepID=A0A8W8NQ09_MAGGI
MQEQCYKLNNLGFKATFIGKDFRESGALEQAHTVTQWGEGDKDEEPFREANIGELRSICPKATLLALTATSGPSQRRRIMKMLCFRSNSDIILDSPDRENIKITSVCIPNSDNLEKVFKWLIDSVRLNKVKTKRHVVFCESISGVSKIYTTFVKHFGNDCELFEMFHSKTDEKVKEIISKDMGKDGNIRVLICTNAAENEDSASDSEDEMTRCVSDKEKQLIHDKLVFYKSQMSIDCIIDFEVVHGLTNEVLNKLVQSSDSIFTPDDVMKKFPIWSTDTATEVSKIISEVVGDSDMYNFAEDTEESD